MLFAVSASWQFCSSMPLSTSCPKHARPSGNWSTQPRTHSSVIQENAIDKTYLSSPTRKSGNQLRKLPMTSEASVSSCEPSSIASAARLERRNRSLAIGFHRIAAPSDISNAGLYACRLYIHSKFSNPTNSRVKVASGTSISIGFDVLGTSFKSISIALSSAPVSKEHKRRILRTSASRPALTATPAKINTRSSRPLMSFSKEKSTLDPAQRSQYARRYADDAEPSTESRSAEMSLISPALRPSGSRSSFSKES